MDVQQHVVVAWVGGQSYDIVVRPGLLGTIADKLAQLLPARKAAIITDSHVGPLLLPALEQSLVETGFETVTAIIPAGEAHKTLPILMPVYDRLLNFGIDRGTPVLALGGGVVGDMAGFVAATILRGVPLVQIPTTLLAMVDASVGGKTGVDHAAGKNLIGSFHQPVAVYIDPLALQTLPPREFRNGLAECIKHDLIRDAQGFATLGAQLDAIIHHDPQALAELIAHNVRIKANVVEIDPLEKAERAHLNLGHTFGHAIEIVSNFSYAHGEAVSLGIVAAAWVSTRMGLIDEESRVRIVEMLRQAGLPVGGLKLPIDAVVDAMRFDKKVKSGRIRFVLLERIGKATVRDDVPIPLIREALATLET